MKGNAVGIHTLSPAARAFLYTLFNAAAISFSDSKKPLAPGTFRAVAPPEGSLASVFRKAAFTARKGTLEDVNEAINAVMEKVNAASGPGLKREIETARLKQALMYAAQVENNGQLKTDLGSFSTRVF